jgi:hypothetical protein
MRRESHCVIHERAGEDTHRTIELGTDYGDGAEFVSLFHHLQEAFDVRERPYQRGNNQMVFRVKAALARGGLSEKFQVLIPEAS